MSYFRKRTFTFCREFWDKIVVIFRTIPFFINGSRFVEMLLSIFSRLEKDFFSCSTRKPHFQRIAQRDLMHAKSLISGTKEGGCVWNTGKKNRFSVGEKIESYISARVHRRFFLEQ